MNLKEYFLILFLLTFSSITAQVGGENVYQFLNLSSSARQIALGGEVLTLIDDVNQPIWNPSVINSDIEDKLSVNYTSYLAGINIGSLSYSTSISRRFRTLHANIKYIDYGSLIESDKNGNELGTFNSSDKAISLGYSYNFPRSHFYIGSNIRFIHSKISNYTSSGISTDFAILYNNPYEPFILTLVARNFGSQINSYNGFKENIPFKFAFGGSYQLEHVPLKWYFTLDNLQKWNVSVSNPSNQTTDLEGNITHEKINFFTNAMRHFIIGAELFPNSAINVRLGYNFKRAAELKLQNARTFSGFSFGFGIKMNKFKLNYAYSKYHSASNASTFSLLIDLDRSR